jgi:hypothetical protein
MPSGAASGVGHRRRLEIGVVQRGAASRLVAERPACAEEHVEEPRHDQSRRDAAEKQPHTYEHRPADDSLASGPGRLIHDSLLSRLAPKLERRQGVIAGDDDDADSRLVARSHRSRHLRPEAGRATPRVRHSRGRSRPRRARQPTRFHAPRASSRSPRAASLSASASAAVRSAADIAQRASTCSGAPFVSATNRSLS